MVWLEAKMNDQVKVVGWLHIVMNGLTLVAGLGLFLFLTLVGGAIAASGGHDAHVSLPIFGAVGAFIFLIVAGASVPGFIAGFGVLNHAQWGRILCIIVSVLHLFNFPVGTFVGGYSLYVLTNAETTALFESRRY